MQVSFSLIVSLNASVRFAVHVKHSGGPLRLTDELGLALMGLLIQNVLKFLCLLYSSRKQLFINTQ